jgi:hypothetical protein
MVGLFCSTFWSTVVQKVTFLVAFNAGSNVAWYRPVTRSVAAGDCDVEAHVRGLYRPFGVSGTVFVGASRFGTVCH